MTSLNLKKMILEVARVEGTHNQFALRDILTDDGEVVTKESEDFRRYAHEYGLKPEWLGKTFESRGQEFTIVGLSTRAKKYKVIARNSEGVGYKFHHDSVIAKMIGL
jgi:hypothetical protein